MSGDMRQYEGIQKRVGSSRNAVLTKGSSSISKPMRSKALLIALLKGVERNRPQADCADDGVLNEARYSVNRDFL